MAGSQCWDEILHRNSFKGYSEAKIEKLTVTCYEYLDIRVNKMS